MLIAIVKQSGGCDYTIECGTKVIYQDDGESESDFINTVMSDYHGFDGIEGIQFYRAEQVIIMPAQVVTEWKIRG